MDETPGRGAHCERINRLLVVVSVIWLGCAGCAKNQPQPLPHQELTKLETRARWYQETLCVELYNGSEWEIREIGISITDHRQEISLDQFAQGLKAQIKAGDADAVSFFNSLREKFGLGGEIPLGRKLTDQEVYEEYVRAHPDFENRFRVTGIEPPGPATKPKTQQQYTQQQQDFFNMLENLPRSWKFVQQTSPVAPFSSSTVYIKTGPVHPQEFILSLIGAQGLPRRTIRE
jgi:hypothetical protein